MNYEIEILRVAQKQLAKIDRKDQPTILEAVRNLAKQPRPVGCVKLSGRDAWRIRVGSYRVLYEIHQNRLIILVVAIGNRKDVYR